MTVEFIKNLIPYGEKFKLIGGKTGKNLYKSWLNKNFDKFKDFEVCSKPLTTDLDIRYDPINKTVEYVTPIIVIYVRGL